ncbi:hypothetical protein BP5796_06388 [Coleophoma crateriformis]|uniref:Chromatin modification-related protein EAF3 n=1 Tax=Coleophoma crateriformis TaxID=565419 RepID=A0A3D8RNC6_9HELO|nr:hypothetical protein BP5796_06388 [Coleophoma crateriformis]
MAPSKAAQAAVAPFQKDERVLCFHGEILYEAKVLDTRQTEGGNWQYYIHYKGWKRTWDDWVPQDRVRKFTDENKELAAQLKAQMDSLQQKPPKSASKGKAGRANGSEFGSSRGSEERHASVAATGGRGGVRRTRDYDLEQRSATKRKYDAFDTDLPRSRGRAVQSMRQSSIKPEAERSGSDPPRKSARLEASNGDWSDPKSEAWDVMRFLDSDECLATDPLMKMPPRNYQYIDASGKLKDRNKYIIQRPEAKLHPKLITHLRNGTATSAVQLYYKDMPEHRNIPLAGMVHDELSTVKEISQIPVVTEIWEESDNAAGGSRLYEAFRKIEALTCIAQLQEEGFHSRPSIKLIIPDQIKAYLVDDWENVTKNQTIVPLPCEHTVNSIMADYVEYEMPKRIPGSVQADILEEVVAGLKEYFEKCLGRILLYRFERQQYLEIREQWAGNEGPLAGKSASDTYGAEHLCRLLVSLPELIAQTNMDQQSVNRLREELSKLTNWLSKHATKYFVKEYETPSQDYIEKARNG